MKKRLATGYTFDASAQTIVHADFSDITLAGIQLITNVTDQVIIYNFADSAKGGTLSTDTLTLEHDTTSMSDTDELMILVEDGVNTQTVSGTVTADLGAVDNAVLDAIAAATAAIETAVEGTLTVTGGGGGTEYTEGTSTDATPTGGVVMWRNAIDSSIVGVSDATPLPVNVEGGGIMTDINDGITTLNTGITTIGTTEVRQVALFDNADTQITDFASKAKQDTIIGHLDGVETLIGTTNTTLTTIDGRVDGIETLLTTIAGDTTDIEAAVELMDDTVAVLGTDTYTEATTKGLIVGAVRRDADTTLVNTTNEIGPLQMDANGRLKVEAFSGETLPVSLTSTTVTGTVAVTQSGTWDEVGINDSGNSITVDQPTGTNLHTVIDSGTITTVTTLTGTTTLTPGTGATNLGKAEDGAHASGDVGVAPMFVRNDTMADFTGADNDYTVGAVTVKGQQITTNAPRGRKLHQVTTITASTSETTVLTAAASTFHDVYGIIVTNTSATATEVAFKDATAGTTRFTLSAPANDTRGFMLPIDAAVNASAVNGNWTATAADSVTSLLITVLAVKNL